MISPHTPLGTKVVALETHGFPGCQIVEGQIYTVARMEIEDFSKQTAVLLQECDHSLAFAQNNFCRIAFRLKWFRYLALPTCLTSLLNTQPVHDREPEVVA